MRIGLIGYGAMGQVVESLFKDEIKYIYSNDNRGNIDDISLMEDIDVILDFSHPDNLDKIIAYAKTHHTPVVFATTNYSQEQVAQIRELANHVGVIQESNFSLGVILLNRLVKEITPILQEDYDIEIIEKHHNKKIDAPSGTAKSLLKSIQEAKEANVVYGRRGIAKREKDDVGVHAIRGGTVVGEHEVLYLGLDEIISLKHTANSKKIFAKGAYKACAFLIKQEKGLYTMEDILFNGGR